MQTTKNNKKSPARPIWKVVLTDFLIACLLLLTFSFFHHALPWLKGKVAKSRAESAHLTETSVDVENNSSYIGDEEDPDTELSSEASAGLSAETPANTADEPDDVSKEEPDEVSAEVPADEPDDRTEWQKKFADHFTDEIIVTDRSYSSPTVSIDVTLHAGGEVGSRLAYYVADIYIASIDCFRTWLANGNIYELYGVQNILEMDLDSGALLGMTGDFYAYQYGGLMVRDGVTYRTDYTDSDICVLYKDGTMKTFAPGEYDKDALLEEDIWQLWHFGPELLGENGEVMNSFNVSTTVSFINPRSAVGYFEPGHYCFVVVDGRQSNWSEGMILPDLSQLFHDLGCVQAYNLDGGGSAVMTFNDEIISHQSNGGDRELGDILIIVDPYAAKEGTDQ